MLAAALMLIAVPPAPANDDAYLREIRAEGNKTERLDRAREEIRRSEEQERTRENKNNKSPPPATVNNRGDFEKQLHRDSPASYQFYTSFPLEKRDLIFKTYLREKKMSAAKRKIVDAYLGI